MGSPIRSLPGLTSDSSQLLRISPRIPNSHDVDPRVVLYPTIGIPLPGGNVWRIYIQGRIAQPAPASFSKRLMLRGLVRAINLSKEEASGEIFSERIGGFLAAPLSGQRIQVEVGGQHYVLRRKSKGSGLFNCKLEIPGQHLEAYRKHGVLSNYPPSPSVSSLVEPTKGTTGSCPVFLAEECGTSVVSDIDDTIKMTEVNFRKRMLQRTFAEPFEPIEGMADAYQKWASQGALFHYVSSSPWQIFSPIDEFLRSSQFPSGSMHLKWFRLRDEIFKRWQLLRRKSKGGIIRGLIKRMPNRNFVLVGDSGERDPEIYAKLASKYPKQVVRICIRQIEANPLDSERLDTIYKRFGLTVPIQIFSNALQLGDLGS